VRLVQISDTHISHLGGTPSENMSLLIEYLNAELRPDLVVHTGDVVIANPDSAEDREAALRLHQQIDGPLRVLPGNHDVGTSAAEPWMGISVTSDRVAGFVSTWGPDRFCTLGSDATRSAGWAFIGMNSERFSSGLPEESEQWDWLADVAGQVRGTSVMLFLHKPLWFPGGNEPGLTVAEADRERLISLFAGARLRVVASGHLHRFRDDLEGEIRTVWSPSLAFAFPPDPERGIGPSPSGIIEYRIEDDTVEAFYRAVPGVRGVANVSTMAEFSAAVAEIGPQAGGRPA
jgi:3',5'-cyclic AMP phosphodiesterase CpdA